MLLSLSRASTRKRARASARTRNTNNHTNTNTHKIAQTLARWHIHTSTHTLARAHTRTRAHKAVSPTRHVTAAHGKPSRPSRAGQGPTQPWRDAAASGPRAGIRWRGLSRGPRCSSPARTPRSPPPGSALPQGRRRSARRRRRAARTGCTHARTAAVARRHVDLNQAFTTTRVRGAVGGPATCEPVVAAEAGPAAARQESELAECHSACRSCCKYLCLCCLIMNKRNLLPWYGAEGRSAEFRSH